MSNAANSGVRAAPPAKLNPSSAGELENVGKNMPRLDRNTPGSGSSASRGGGSPPAITAYQKKSCTNSGPLGREPPGASQQEFPRRAAKADRGSENGGERDADERYGERIRQADRERIEVGVGSAVAQEGRFADLEPGLAREEPEAARDAARPPSCRPVAGGGAGP